MPLGKKKLPPSLLALGRECLPAKLDLAGGTYRLTRQFKHDFFAATALYAGPVGKVVLKVGRKADCLGLPLDWIGSVLAAHESEMYQQLQGLDCVPRYLGRWGRQGLIHEYIEGHSLQKGEWVPDGFFAELRQAIEAIHARGMAYVDLEKPQNVIVGDDGRPYLIDFQISWAATKRFLGKPTAGWLVKMLQNADRYHLLKLQRRCRPDQLTAEQIEASYRPPWFINAHRRLTRPATLVRRRTLDRLEGTKRKTGSRRK